ncbi:nucleotidyltransferase domain-containing protein [Candidatus Methylobacter oryzae]|uniref:nucleotidyltransferase domain-containing protein n=1 Tax=Candidatus Methylobacter oryzae TaxID=2497749 RepID=UPI00138745AA|nr:nucleotidyltransferase domain-containing protein [Candidatus Methylobacter oryzae]
MHSGFESWRFIVRLDQTQKKALKIAFQNLKQGDEAYLFGSRVDDAKRGGDIDLLIFSQQPGFELSRKITRDFFKHCEEKLDVLVINPRQMTEEQALFVQSIDKMPLSNI